MKALGHRASFPGDVVDEIAQQRGNRGSRVVYLKREGSRQTFVGCHPSLFLKFMDKSF